jgi:uncharacterized protein YjaG (DUF416 family)
MNIYLLMSKFQSWVFANQAYTTNEIKDIIPYLSWEQKYLKVKMAAGLCRIHTGKFRAMYCIRLMPNLKWDTSVFRQILDLHYENISVSDVSI